MSDLAAINRWWIFLGHSDDIGAIDWRMRTRSAELVILSDDPRIPVRKLPPATVRLAYLSVGEAEQGRAYFSAIRSQPFLIEDNPAWPGNYRVDVRDPRWQDVLLAQEAPRLLRMGFQGFMLDTLDTATYLEGKDPARFAGCRQALRELLAALRRAFPRAVVLANGTEALADAAPFVDGYVTEGLFATYDPGTGAYRETTRDERAWRLAQIDRALQRHRRPVFAIEYASETDVTLGAWASHQASLRGFKPFVSVRALNRVP